ncbi:MAG: hypothetical protein AAGM67_09115 [Bacteroidota bacterium]
MLSSRQIELCWALILVLLGKVSGAGFFGQKAAEPQDTPEDEDIIFDEEVQRLIITFIIITVVLILIVVIYIKANFNRWFESSIRKSFEVRERIIILFSCKCFGDRVNAIQIFFY